jgi:hypothetical protein
MNSQEKNTQAYNNYEINKYREFTLLVDLHRVQWLGFMKRNVSLRVCKSTKFLQWVNDYQFFRRVVNLSVTKPPLI